jgi:hypothetical protein
MGKQLKAVGGRRGRGATAAHSNRGKPFTIFIVSRLTVITLPMSLTIDIIKVYAVP